LRPFVTPASTARPANSRAARSTAGPSPSSETVSGGRASPLQRSGTYTDAAATDFDVDGDTSKGAIRVLGREGVLDEETTDTLVAAVGVGNVLAHEYGDVDYDPVYENLQTGLDVYDAFSRQVAQWVREQA
jgi:hypothetical protein